MYVNVVFVIRCLYSAVSLTLVKEQRLIRIIIIIRVHSSCKSYTVPEGRAKTVGDGETSFDFLVKHFLLTVIREFLGIEYSWKKSLNKVW